MPVNPLAAPLIPLLFAIPALAGQDGAQKATHSDIVEIAPDNHDRMTVPVHFVGKGPYRFLIDTGSQNTVLSSSLMRQLELTPTARARLVGIAGSSMVDTVEIESISLGKRSYYGLLAPILERQNIGADGILGLDSLQDQRVLMDFRKGVMAIDDAKKLGGNRGFEIVVNARRRFGQLVLTDAVIDGVKTDIVLDTGAQSSIGNLALGQALFKLRKETARIQSVTGQEVEAKVSLGRHLIVQGMRINNVAIAYTDAPAFKVLGLDKRPALFLGMRELRTFDRVAIDFHTRKVLFDLPRNAF
jgi:predicted aspartyl protease